MRIRFSFRENSYILLPVWRSDKNISVRLTTQVFTYRELTVAELVKKFHVFYAPRTLIFRLFRKMSTLFSKTPNLHSSLSVSDQFSQPCKTTNKIIEFKIIRALFYSESWLVHENFGFSCRLTTRQGAPNTVQAHHDYRRDKEEREWLLLFDGIHKQRY